MKDGEIANIGMADLQGQTSHASLAVDLTWFSTSSYVLRADGTWGRE